MIERYINYDEGTGVDAELQNILNDVNKGEELIITLEGESINRANYIADFLESNGFQVLPKGGHDRNQYHLMARKKQH